MTSLERSRFNLAAAATALAVGAFVPIGAAQADPGAGYPASCSTFRINLIQRDLGSALEWVLDHDCHFSPEITEVVVTTSEDSVVRDRHVIPVHGKFNGRTTRYVLLPPKQPCASSLVRVEARYWYKGIGDNVSSEARMYYDPNDNC